MGGGFFCAQEIRQQEIRINRGEAAGVNKLWSNAPLCGVIFLGFPCQGKGTPYI